MRKVDIKNPTIMKSTVITAVMSVLLVIAQLIIQAGGDTAPYLSYLKNPLIFIINFLFFFLFMSFISFLTSRIWLGFAATSIPLNLALIINHYKISFRDEPFKMSDISLGQEALSIAQNYDIKFHFGLFLATVINIALIVLLARLVGKSKLSLKQRASVCVVAVAVFAVFFGAIINDRTEFYDDLSIEGASYYEVNAFSCKGFVYSFFAKSLGGGNLYVKPENYSDEYAKQILDEYTAPEGKGTGEPVNVIAIMSEAFWDCEKAQKLEMYDDPLVNIKRIREEAEYGRIIVPGFAGSTVSTEFEFLTGANLTLVGKDKPALYKTSINTPLYCLPSLFKSMGYDTLAIHPGHHWFYNRHNVYEHMGFDKFITARDLPDDLEKVNFYISDNVTSDLIIDNYKKYLESGADNGYFNFTVTIQNHGPYSEEPTERQKRYVRPDGIDDSMYNVINNYLNGLSDADALLGKVTDYAETVDEPTVVVFFGDHLPFFDQEFEGYNIIGYDVNSGSAESLVNRYSIPYIVWGNTALKEQVRSHGGTVPDGEHDMISSSYLSTEMMKYMGMELPPYFKFVNEMEKRISVIAAEFCVENGKFAYDMSDEAKNIADKAKVLQYYNIKRYSAGEEE